MLALFTRKNVSKTRQKRKIPLHLLLREHIVARDFGLNEISLVNALALNFCYKKLS